MGVDHCTVHFILQDHGLCTYHYMQVQGLMPHEHHLVSSTVRGLYGNTNVIQVLLNISCGWTKSIHPLRCLQQKNSQWWAWDSPHVTSERSHHIHWGTNVLADIIGSNVIGSYLLPHHLSGPVYCFFLQEVVSVLLEDVPLAVCHNMWFEHDGTLAHF
jgi:hypothetical protein